MSVLGKRRGPRNAVNESEASGAPGRSPCGTRSFCLSLRMLCKRFGNRFQFVASRRNVPALSFTCESKVVMKSTLHLGIPPMVLRIKPAADYIGVSRAFLYQLFTRGELQRIRLGGRAAGVLRTELDRWVAAQAAL